MFDKKYEDRLRAWREFREGLETSLDPVKDAVDLYSSAPLVNIQVDPYDDSTWLDPWTLLYENNYCEFAIVLGIFYTLQLTERFSDSHFEIHICTNNVKSEVNYLLYIDDIVVDVTNRRVINQHDLSKELQIETKYSL